MKIFCIGFHKTGTTSLTLALRTLGYRVTGPNGVHDPDIAQNVYALADRLVEAYDAFQDNPWPLLYREMDQQYPGSKFILTLRDTESWIKSQVKHFAHRTTPMREWIYGTGYGAPLGHEEVYIDRFEQHNREVLDYFKDRPEDLLVLNLAEGQSWEPLCAFLGRDIPEVPFPHANKAQPYVLRRGVSYKRRSLRALNRFVTRLTNFFS